MTKNIKAPFNFIPISNQVYIPSWGDKVSQDIPLKDSLSGNIKLEITAQTPIFVSSGRDSDNTLSEFTNYIDGNGKKHYYVPGTSIKGMIRNVLEIMSFGKMNNIQDDRYAIRDIKNDKVYTIIKEQENIKCGWLYKNNGKIYIENCGTPKRVGHDELDRYYSTRFVDNFKIGGRSTERNNNKTIKTDARWAKYKYENLFKGNNFECIYENAPIKNLEQRVSLTLT